MNPTDRILPGVALMIAFCIIAPLNDVAAKLATASVSAGQITAARFLVQAALMAPLVWALRAGRGGGAGAAVDGGPAMGGGRRIRMLTLLRAGFLILSTFSFVAALRVMPLADALAIVFVEPFILLWLGKVFLGEQVGRRRIMASLVGFVGALLIIRPSLSIFGPVALVPLVTAASFAGYMLVTRSLARGTHPVVMQYQTAFWGAVLWLPVLAVATWAGGPDILQLRWPQGIVWAWLLGVGVSATISHMAITWALKWAPSATLAPLAYLEIVTAAWFGYLVFGDVPAPLTWAGVAVIVASGLYVIWRERMQARQAARTIPAPGQ